jgi:hypothetical protein
MKKINCLICVLLLFSACKKTETDQGFYSAGYEYFPVNIGHQLIYQVDSIVYDDFNGSVDTFTYQCKELITDTFRGINGNLNQRLEWYYRQHDTDEWEFYHAGFSTLTVYTAEVTQQNEKIIRLIFPVNNSSSWNGYAYTTFTDKPQFYYDDIGDSYPGVNELFINTITVVEQNDSNLIELMKRDRIYAPYIGMVYSRNDSLNTQFDSGGQPKINGLRLRYKLSSYVK